MEKLLLVIQITSVVLPQYLTQHEAGHLLAISERTVRNWSRKKILKPYQFGRRVFFKRQELMKLIKHT